MRGASAPHEKLVVLGNGTDIARSSNRSSSRRAISQLVVLDEKQDVGCARREKYTSIRKLRNVAESSVLE